MHAVSKNVHGHHITLSNGTIGTGSNDLYVFHANIP